MMKITKAKARERALGIAVDILYAEWGNSSGITKEHTEDLDQKGLDKVKRELLEIFSQMSHRYTQQMQRNQEKE